MNSPIDSSRPAPLSILLIDDEVELSDVLRMLLESCGHHVVTAAGGRQGLDEFKAMRPDLVICDAHMPGIDGYDVLRALRAVKQGSAVPVIFLSGSVSEAEVALARRLGAATFLSKPCSFGQLIAAVEQFQPGHAVPLALSA